MDTPTLTGVHVRLEPLEARHVPALLDAANEDREPYRWTFIPSDRESMRAYVEQARLLQASGVALPFAIVRAGDGRAIGSTRFFDLERWNWPVAHPRSGRAAPDVAEIGYTWLAASAIRTAANTEAKLLLLGYAFETLDVLRICFHTDARNERSANALERIGAQFEGILHAHRLATDVLPRDSKRYVITAAQWPAVREHLRSKLSRTPSL